MTTTSSSREEEEQAAAGVSLPKNHNGTFMKNRQVKNTSLLIGAFLLIVCLVSICDEQMHAAALREWILEEMYTVPVTSKLEHDKAWNISVIIPFCNRLHSLQDAVESALKQTYPIHEVIIALDSGEKCVKNVNNIWAEQQDTTTRVRLLKAPPCDKARCGTIGRTRKFAIEHANPFATHYALLDDDDVWFPEKTTVQVEKMIAGNYSFSSSDAVYPKDNKGRCKGTTFVSHNTSMSHRDAYALWNGGRYRQTILSRLGLKPDDLFPSHITFEILRKQNLFVASSVIIAKDVYLGFDENLPNRSITEDIELWLRTLKVTPGLLIPEPLIIYDNYRSQCDDPSTSPLAA